MKITTLKKKYPEFWDNVYASIKFDFIEAAKPNKYMSEYLDRLVYNATAIAILEHHKQLKLIKTNE